MEKFLEQIREERARQDKKFGIQDHHPVLWMSILGEEFGECCKATTEVVFGAPHYPNATWQHLKDELVQTAAVCVAMLESMERDGK